MAKQPKEEPLLKYKMDLYLPNGLLRPAISRVVFASLSVKYGDVIRAVSMNHWSTIDEIFETYTNQAKRLRFDPFRNLQQIKDAIREMVEAGLIEVR